MFKMLPLIRVNKNSVWWTCCMIKAVLRDAPISIKSLCEVLSCIQPEKKLEGWSHRFRWSWSSSALSAVQTPTTSLPDLVSEGPLGFQRNTELDLSSSDFTRNTSNQKVAAAFQEVKAVTSNRP